MPLEPPFTHAVSYHLPNGGGTVLAFMPSHHGLGHDHRPPLGMVYVPPHAGNLEQRLDAILMALQTLTERITQMSGTFQTDLATMTANIADLADALTTGFAANDKAIQDLKDKIASGGAVTPAELTQLETNNSAIKTAADAIRVHLGAVVPPVGPVFDPNDPTPNGSVMADGTTIRNTPGADPANPIAGYNPSLPMTT